MALRNQPYLPLYIQDYLTDEKLNNCSFQTQGIYIKIMCILHKQANYGSILFKQKDKQYNQQKASIENYFAEILIKQLPVQYEIMVDALTELLENGVLTFDGEKLYQKRMFTDGLISLERSKAGKKGGGNPALFKQNGKLNNKLSIEQKDKHFPENENEYEINNKLYFKNNKINEKFLIFLENQKNPKNEQQIELLVEKLKSFGNDDTIIESLNNSIISSYPDVYPPKKDLNGKPSSIWIEGVEHKPIKSGDAWVYPTIIAVEINRSDMTALLSDGSTQVLGRNQSLNFEANALDLQFVKKGLIQ